MMNTLKIALASLGLVSIVGLAACQSQPKPADRSDHHPDRKEMRGDDMRHHNKDHHKGFDHKHGKDGRDHDGRRFDKRIALTAEQKAAMQTRRAERHATMQALQKACEGKVGQTISVKVGEKDFDGTCQVRFKPTRMDKTIADQKVAPVAPTAPASN